MQTEQKTATLAAEVHQERVLMTDGVRLATDVYLPAVAPVPTVLLRTPYGRRELWALASEADPWRVLKHGFALVMQDVRGLGDSEGQFDATLSDGVDGAQTVDWIARQPWSDGRVVLAGQSYNGFVQFATARERPEGLMAIAPAMTGSPRTIHYPGGALRLAGVTGWAAALVAGSVVARRPSKETAGAQAELDAFLAAGPLQRIHALLAPGPALAARTEPIRAWWGTGEADPYWQRAAATPAIELPAIHMTGWYDGCLPAALEGYEAFVALSEKAERPMPQHLIIGPWLHSTSRTAYPEFELSMEAAMEPIEWQLEFLRAAIDGTLASHEPAVRSFALGRNAWVNFSEWPPRDAVARQWYLSPGVEEAHDAGRLMEAPASEQATMRYAYDPADPAPTLGGRNGVPGRAGPFDMAALSERADVLTFSTDPLTEELELAGRVAVELTVASSAPATDYIAHLCLQRPDGQMIALCNGVWSGHMKDLRYADGPGDGRRCRVDLGHVHVHVRPGERLALQLTSSNFPELYPNPNTGHDLFNGVPIAWHIAEQTIICGGSQPSVLVIDVRSG